MRHMTHDTWHLTCDTWHVTGLGRWTFSQNFSSLTGLGLKVIWRFGGKGWVSQLMNEWMNDEGVCRTAPATPGLLNIEVAIVYLSRSCHSYIQMNRSLGISSGSGSNTLLVPYWIRLKSFYYWRFSQSALALMNSEIYCDLIFIFYSFFNLSLKI